MKKTKVESIGKRRNSGSMKIHTLSQEIIFNPLKEQLTSSDYANDIDGEEFNVKPQKTPLAT